MEPKLLVESRTERVDSSYKSVEKTDKGYAVHPENQNKKSANQIPAGDTEETPTELKPIGGTEEKAGVPNRERGEENNNLAAETGISKLEEQNQVRAEQAVIQQLKLRDQEVKAHEQAHASVGGSYAGNASFSYTRGPNGTLYATSGEVGISTSPVAGDPQATLQKARQVQAAAMAPLNPSSQDRAVAARAGQMALDAQANLAAERIQSSREAASVYIEERGAARVGRADDAAAAAGPPKDNENTEARIENRDAKHLYNEVYVNKAGSRLEPSTGVNSQA
ncbi:MAG: hypothetical protein KUG67_03160 [Proteobacteria bacterium]|nr:hypothetical protein [Pseudomonadota bacterium]